MKADEIQGLEYSIVPLFEEDDYSFTELFHEYTKLNRANTHVIASRVPAILRDPKLRAMMARSWKTYRGHERLPLPSPHLGEMTLEEALRNRCSLSSVPGAEFSGDPINLADLGSVLGYSYGVTHSHPIQGLHQVQHFRATPSAGALYPLEIYALVFRVEGLNEGVYHYGVVDHCLEVVRKGPVRDEFLKTTTYYDMCSKAPVVLVVTSVFQRSLFKYQYRGYRFIMNDVGALLQSFYLVTTALGLGTCALAGFFDDEVGNLIGINNVDEAVAICFLLGPLK